MRSLYYHNPNCSKSRQGLALLEQNNIDFKIIHYLKEVLSQTEILTILSTLTQEKDMLFRKKELNVLNIEIKNVNNNTLSQLIIDNPQILQRPILVRKNKSIIGRPPELLLTI